MGKKLKILQLAPRFPFPEDDGGKIGIANIFKQFSKQGCDVTLFSLNNEKIPEQAIEEAKKYGKILIYDHNTKNSIPRVINSFLTKKSIYLNKHINDEILRKLIEIVDNDNFDIVHADHTCMAPLALYLKERRGIPYGLRLHNIEYLIWKRYYDKLPNYHPGKIYLKQQFNLLKNAEAELISKSDINFAITEHDLNEAKIISGAENIVIASAGVDIDEWNPDNSIERNQFEMVLATTFRWKHNVEGVLWFIQNVMPVLKNKLPEIKLTLIGKSPPNIFSRYKKLGVNCIGYVDKVQPYYNKAYLNISPLFVGSGIRIKILEAMAMELPVVATPVAAEGIESTESNGLLIANTVNDFVNIIIKIMNNKDLRNQLGRDAREFIKSNYTWERTVKIMIDSYKRLLSK